MPTPCPNDVEHFRDLNARVRRQRVPFFGSIDLTRRCNLKCIHCYVGPEPPGGREDELSTDQWLCTLERALDAGCLLLLITGGEPLLRDDFAQIYTFAKEHGFLVTLFTNGTLVTDELAALLGDLPPRHVEISVYGASPAVHERITGVADSFARMLRGIELLLEHGVRVRLKTVLMRPNFSEWRGMAQIAARYGLGFRMDPAIFPRLDGDRTPLQLRVDPKRAAAAELADPVRRAKWKDYCERVSRYEITSRLYKCGAGISAFHISASGRLQPCLLTPHIGYDLTRGTFREGWQHIVDTLSRKQAPPQFECRTCTSRFVCGACPGFMRLATGSETTPCEYLCRLGDARLYYMNAGGAQHDEDSRP